MPVCLFVAYHVTHLAPVCLCLHPSSCAVLYASADLLAVEQGFVDLYQSLRQAGVVTEDLNLDASSSEEPDPAGSYDAGARHKRARASTATDSSGVCALLFLLLHTHTQKHKEVLVTSECVVFVRCLARS